MAVGTAKLSQECWTPSSGFAGDKVSQHSPPRPLFPLKLDFHKSLMDDGPCLASSLSLLGSLRVGNKGFPAIAFPAVWMMRKKAALDSKEGGDIYQEALLQLRGENFLVPFSLKKCQVSTTQLFSAFPL